MAELVYISDEAYDFLTQMAIVGEYVRARTHRREGMGKFLNALSRVECYDHRPHFLSRMDNDLIANNRTPFWANGIHVKRARLLELDYRAIERYCATAVSHKIFIAKGFIGGPKPKSPVSIAGSVIEALGIEYLRPNRWPVNIKYRASAS